MDGGTGSLHSPLKGLLSQANGEGRVGQSAMRIHPSDTHIALTCSTVRSVSGRGSSLESWLVSYVTSWDTSLLSCCEQRVSSMVHHSEPFTVWPHSNFDLYEGSDTRHCVQYIN